MSSSGANMTQQKVKISKDKSASSEKDVHSDRTTLIKNFGGKKASAMSSFKVSDTDKNESTSRKPQSYVNKSSSTAKSGILVSGMSIVIKR